MRKRRLCSGLILALCMCFFGSTMLAQSTSSSASASASASSTSTTTTTSVKKGSPCTSYAGLMDGDKDGFCVFVGTSTSVSTGFTGDIDCDDEHRSVNPGAREIVGDGIDQDCLKGDLVLSVSDPVFKRFVGEYGGKTPDPLLFITEYDACTAGALLTPPTCSVDLVLGTFVPSERYFFKDIYVNGTKILRNHGEEEDGREPVSFEENSHYRPSVKTARRPSLSRKTVTAIAHAQATVVVGNEAERRRAGDEGIQFQINAINIANLGRDTAVNNLGDRVNRVDNALQQEVYDRKDGETTESKNRRDADIALGTRITAFEGRSTPFIEGGLVATGVYRRALQEVDADRQPTGGMVRNAMLGGVGFGLRGGLQTSDYEVALMGNFSFGSDGQGQGSDTAYQIGLEALYNFDSLNVGGFGAFYSSVDHVNAVDLSVLDNGFLIGPSINGDLVSSTPVRVTGFARAGLGWSFYGTKGSVEGDDLVVSGNGFTAMLQAGVLFGAGDR